VINACRRVCGLIFLFSPARARHPAHGPAGAVAVHALAVGTEEDRPVDAFADRQVEAARGAGCEWDRDDLASLAPHRQCAVTVFAAHRRDVRR
jgi:hypothetical protein